MVSRAETDNVNLPACLGEAACMGRAGISAWHATLRCRGIELFSKLRPLYPKGKESAVHIPWNQKPTRLQHLKFEQEISYINLVGNPLLRDNPDGRKRN